MPTKIKLKVIQARDLPIMDHANQTTDAYVEVKLSDFYSERTEIAHKSLNPKWDADFVIEVSHDGDIMKHPLEIKVWDRDTISSDDVIGGVLLDLSNLLLSETNEIFGWFPIYDTMRGVRGELKLSVSLLFFGKATGTGADSTDSVLFSYGPAAPPNMVITQISGFVEELLVDDDPEYDWKDQFRSSRTSNQTRQYVLYKLSAKLRREIGAKAIGLGCNAVIGFKKYIDYESEGSIVVRGFGTAVTLKKARPQGYFSTSSNFAVGSAGNASTIDLEEVAPSRISLAPISEASSTPGNAQSSAVASASASIATLPTATTTESEDEANALSLASQLPAATGILPRKDNSGSLSRSEPHHFSVLKMHAGDIQLLTISQFPPPTVVRIAGVVTTHSVKVLPKGYNEEKSRATRDRWWSELRAEVKSHARYVGCQYVLGYRETTVFHDDVILMTASGTAANLKVLSVPSPTPPPNLDLEADSVAAASPHGSTGSLLSTSAPTLNPGMPTQASGASLSSTMEITAPGALPGSYQGPSQLNNYIPLNTSSTIYQQSGTSAPHVSPYQLQWQHNVCGSCHIPYKIQSSPYKLKLERCGVCGRKMVPEMILATIEPPPGLAIVGQGQLIEAYDARPIKKYEEAAKEIGEAITFLEFDLYKQLTLKMKMYSMNACFKLVMRISVGDNVIIGHMQATGMCVSALPRPSEIRTKLPSDPSTRSKAVHAQFAKLSSENSRLVSESSAELFPDASMPVLWKKSTGSNFGSGSVEDVSGGYLAGELTHGSVGFGTSSTGIPHDRTSNSTEPRPSTEAPLEDMLDPTLNETGDQEPEVDKKEVNQPSYLIELENELDDELIALLVSDHPLPSDFAMCSTQALPGTKSHTWHSMQLLTVVRIIDWTPTKSATQLRKAFASIFHSLYAHLSFRMHLIRPCSIVGLKTELRISDDDEIQLTFTGMVLHSTLPWRIQLPTSPTAINPSSSTNLSTSATPRKKSADESVSTTTEGKAKKKKIKKATSSEGLLPLVDSQNNDGSSKAPSKDKDTPKDKESRDSKEPSVTSSSAKDKKDSDPNIPSKSKEAPSVLAQSSPSPVRHGSKDQLTPGEGTATTDNMDGWPATSGAGDLLHSSGSAVTTSGINVSIPFGMSMPSARMSHNISAYSTPVVPNVEITPLNYIPGSVMERYVGTIHLSFIRESFSLREAGGMNVFTQNLVLEAQRIARAHVLALGANVLASYNMELTQKFKVPKNQGYCLLTITGDAILAVPSSSASGIGYRKLAKAQTFIGMPATPTPPSHQTLPPSLASAIMAGHPLTASAPSSSGNSTNPKNKQIRDS